MSREEVLRRIKTGLRGSQTNRESKEKSLFLSADDGEIQERVIRLRSELAEKKWGLINRFVDEIAKASGRAIVTKGEDEVREFIINLIDERNVKSLAIWRTDLLTSLREFLLDRGLRFASPGNKSDMAEVNIGITEANFAIAETGTIVLISNENQPRSVSLIPPIHIAVIKSDIIVENLDQLFFLVQNSSEPTSCMTFITGPSRTADIELNLTLGVHGPKELFVVIHP
jgi:L-lactate dehydrogenase complex protein LldG